MLCDKMGSIQKALLLCFEGWVSFKKVLYDWVATWNSCFSSQDNIFFLKGWQTDKVWLFRPRYLADIFLKLKEVSLSLQGKQLTVFVGKNKMRFQVKN